MNERQPVDLLFFGAHADDVDLSAGATIVKMVKSGLRVGMVDLTHGEMGTRGAPHIRKREAQAAARILGASFREQLDLGDGNLRTDRAAELEIIDVIRRCRPSLVFTSWPDDRHPDHTRTGRLVTEASFYAGLKKLETDLPAHRPQATIYYLQNYMIPPSFVVDVSAHYDTKRRALDCHTSQFTPTGTDAVSTRLTASSFRQLIETRDAQFGARGTPGSALVM